MDSDSQRATIQELRDELRSGESLFVSRRDHPVLVGRASGLAVRSGFRTEHISSSQAPANDLAEGGEDVGGQVFSVKKRPGGQFPDLIGVGRTRNVDVILPFAQISKYHAYISGNMDAGFEIADAGSANGTFLAGRRLQPKIKVALPDEARLRLAEYEFTFLYPASLVNLLTGRGLAIDGQGF